jgi:ribosomal protein L11 methyltransferase
MWLWKKVVEPLWIEAKEETLRQYAGNDLAVVDLAGHKRLRLEVACKSRNQVRDLIINFGGRFEKLPRNWLERVSREQRAKPLRIGNRLVIDRLSSSRSGGFQTAGAIWKSPFLDRKGKRPVHLIIPAGAAFGTGEHVTTAMSLRILEEITRKIRPGWSAADIGTGSGALALAARSFAAGRVVAVDIDPVAISTARANAHLNKIDGIDFRQVDAREWRPRGKFDVVVANLFSELLVQILPVVKTRLRAGGWLILSGVLRREEHDFIRALKANNLYTPVTRRRGKWIAVLARLR